MFKVLKAPIFGGTEMEKFDEDKKMIRYKCGYYSCMFLVRAIIINTILDMFNIQWGETKETEVILLMFLAMFVFIISSVYNNAYLEKARV